MPSGMPPHFQVRPDWPAGTKKIRGAGRFPGGPDLCQFGIQSHEIRYHRTPTPAMTRTATMEELPSRTVTAVGRLFLPAAVCRQRRSGENP